ncbi:MAG: acyl-CoA thioesterase [Desulfobacteraceae bacterium]|nr:MAG: acyl-CoA thioesterase [Desulfobacteraceae bacterium]
MYNRTACRVIYADTDRMGNAYYANYFRWFEIGRSELIRSLGLTYKKIEESGIFLPVSEAHCKYFSPIAYDEMLTIETHLDRGMKGGFKFDYRIYRTDEQLAAEGYTRHPCVNTEGRVVRPPKFLTELFKIPNSKLQIPNNKKKQSNEEIFKQSLSQMTDDR